MSAPRCGSTSSVSKAQCVLEEGHPADSATRFHRFATTKFTPGPWGHRFATTKFTPGPWGLCDSSDARSKEYIRPLVLRDDATRPAVARICTTGYGWEEWRANARLIAAAPDLIEAAAAAHVYIWAVLKVNPPKDAKNEAVLRGLERLLDKAIAKTQGRS